MRYVSYLDDWGIRIYDTDTKKTEYIRRGKVRIEDIKDIDGVTKSDNIYRIKVSNRHKNYEMKLMMAGMYNEFFDCDTTRQVMRVIIYDEIEVIIFNTGRINIDSSKGSSGFSLTIEEYERYTSADEDKIKNELLSFHKIFEDVVL